MSDRVGQQFGNYRLTRLLGRGGFAEVYLGEHTRLNMQAAIKVLHTYLADEDVEKFQNEAQIIATLVHPNIVRLLDFDVRDGIPFLIMDYAPYGTLRQRYTRGTQVPLSEVVASITQVAHALQYAHDQKLIHRDIKPENMLISRRNEVVLSDFGIAIMAHSTHSMMTQASGGTIPYMAPEQIQEHPRPASDQYALGVIVYEWLCGRRPFDGAYAEILAKHLMTPPPSLRETVPNISPDVEQVVLTALAKDPKQRFGSIQAFATALEQASRSVQTQPASSVQAITVLPSSILPLPPTVLATPAAQPLPPTVLASPSGKIPQSEGNSGSVSTPDRPDDVPPLAGNKGQTHTPRPVVLSPDQAESSHPPQLIEREAASGFMGVLAWSPDGSSIVSTYEKTIQCWNATTIAPISYYDKHSDFTEAVAWSPDGNFIASASRDRTVQIWDPATGKRVVTYRLPEGWIKDVAWSPDSKSIAFCYGNTVQVRDTSTHKILLDYMHSWRVIAVAWSPDGNFIASASKDDTIQIRYTTTGKKIVTYKGYDSDLWAKAWDEGLQITWAPDSKRIAISFNKTIQVRDTSTHKVLLGFDGHSKLITAVTWSPDGNFIASASKDGTVQIWNATTGNHVTAFSARKRHAVKDVAWAPDSKRIAFCSPRFISTLLYIGSVS